MAQGSALFVAEGRLVVERLIRGGGYAIDSVLVTPTAGGRSRPRWRTRRLRRRSAIVEGDHRVQLSPRLSRARSTPTSARALDTFANARVLVVLEGMENPDNVGGIFRSAAAFGAGGVILDPPSSDPLYRKALRTSMGAVLRVPFTRVEAWPEAIEAIRRMGFTIAALTPAAARPLTSSPSDVAADYGSRSLPARRAA